MGMPVIKASDVTREQAITDLILSVALEQAALSHILNAEGEKLQKVISLDGVSLEDLLSVNESVQSMITAVTELEEVLKAKLELFVKDVYVSET